MASVSKHEVVSQTGVASLQESLVPPVQFLGFWTAVVVPFMLLGLITAGLATEYPLVLVGLLAVNVVGLVLGKEHNP